MTNDYRSTVFCPKFDNLIERKSSVVVAVKRDHPNAIDMHTYISNNNLPYKVMFIETYNFKCAYCGLSIDIIPKEMFEIDHFIYKKSFSSKAKAGYIENLVLACHSCNHKKNSLPIPEGHRELLHPDNENIKNVFTRDDNFYIIITDTYKNDNTIMAFHEQLGLGDDIRRLDYLLMNMVGIQRKTTHKPDIYTQLGQAIDKLRKKRNIV